MGGKRVFVEERSSFGEEDPAPSPAAAAPAGSAGAKGSGGKYALHGSLSMSASLGSKLSDNLSEGLNRATEVLTFGAYDEFPVQALGLQVFDPESARYARHATRVALHARACYAQPGRPIPVVRSKL